ncbi:MAG: hypothetical protein ACON5O_04930 [Lentimonas sp.]
MSQSRKQDAIGFPPPLMGEEPIRLPVLAETDEWLALYKLGGLALREYPWDTQPNLDAALNRQLQAGKPELVNRGASIFGSVYYMDPAISGVALFGKQRESLAELRNHFGSGDMDFRFTFVSGAKPNELEDRFTADAPLLPHDVKPKMIPSTAKGKKSFTDFELLSESLAGYTLWEARASFFRVHQVRAHAAVHGIPVLGDDLYGGSHVPTQRELMPKKRGAGLDVVAFQGLALHLNQCQLDDEAQVICSFSKQMQLFIKRLGLEAED